MIVAVSMMRDEADVAATVVRHLLEHGVDRVVVNDNNSVDGTGELLAAVGAEVTVLPDVEVGYYQDRKMSALAALAYEMGASWVLPFDADEVWLPTEHDTLRDFFASCNSDVVKASGFDHIACDADDWGECDPLARMVHRRQFPQDLPKVAFRAHPDPHVHMGNHNVDRPGLVCHTGLTYRHFQYRTFEQYRRKVRNGREAYEASDLHWNYGTHWRIDGSLDDGTLLAKWDDMRSETGLVCDPAPVKR